MSNAITEYIEQFAYLTGKIGKVREKEEIIAYTLIFIGICLCTLGIILYRQMIAVFTFTLVAQGIIFLMGDSSSWGSTVTAFAIIGVVAAYFVWDKKFFDGIILCMILGGLIAAEYTSSAIIVIIAILAGLALFLLFPVETICILSTISGVLILRSLFVTLGIGWSVVIGVTGLSLQIILSWKTRVFDKRYPDWTLKLLGRRID